MTMTQQRVSLPEAPTAPYDRFRWGITRWTNRLVQREALQFVARLAELADRWTDPARRSRVERKFNWLYQHGLINATEHWTVLNVLNTWPDQAPGAKMAVMVAWCETLGMPFPADGRVLTARLAV